MSIFDRIAVAVTQKAVAKASAAIPSKVQKHLPLARKLLMKGPEAAANMALDLLLEKFGVIQGGSLLPGESPALRMPTSLLGGITLKQARQVFERSAEIDYAKANLWCIHVMNLSNPTEIDFNFFATDVSYPAFTVNSEGVTIGSGEFVVPGASQRIEMRVTTLDDAQGSIKKWFLDRRDRMCHKDGTVGLPIDYLFMVEVMHAFISEDAEGAVDAHVETYIMQPGSMDYDLSRRDDALQQLQMTFVQFDTFAALA